MTYRKKMIEVALPLEAINVASAREKSIRHGHPSTLHLWWARRPLAACRAVLFASLVDDPDSDPAYAHYDTETREHMAGEKRQQLFDLITELVQWENSNNELVINAARAEIARCVASRKIETGELKKDHKLSGGETVYDLVVKGHGDLPKLRAGTARLPHAEAVNAFLTEHAPPVLDPFAGGGSIPLEAQRLGLRAYASDLNPVPVLINKAMIEIPPKFADLPPVNPESRGEAGPAGKKGTGRGGSVIGEPRWRGAQGLAADVRHYGNWMRDEAEKRIGHLYPKIKIVAGMAKDRPDLKPYIGEELMVIAWLWARTVKCPNPACGARAPLVRSFWVSTGKRGQAFYSEPLLDRAALTVRFRIRSDGEPPKHTTDRTGGRCLFCERFIKKAELREIAVAHGLAEIPLAIVAEGLRGRVYLDGDLLPRPIITKPDVPFLDQPMTNDRRWFSPPLYGLPNFADLFTARQLTTLVTFSDLTEEVRNRVLKDGLSANTLPNTPQPLEEGGDGPQAYADSIATYLAFLVDQLSNQGSTLTGWYAGNQQLMMTFSRQAMPMVWDYAESNPLCESTGSFHNLFDRLLKGFDNIPGEGFGRAEQADASQKLIAPTSCFIATDPPYYDNIGYADLSDFFYAWMRRTLIKVYPKLLSTVLTPKAQELIASPHRHNGSREAAKAFFERGLRTVFGRMRQEQSPEVPIVIFYAFKQTEAEDDLSEGGDGEGGGINVSTGWETILAALIDTGFVVTGTWPVRTENNRGLKSEVNALASSVVLTCAGRPEAAALATRREFLSALKRELPDALKHLQRGNIAPVDLAQASVGPGMAVFTRYARVIEADGSSMKVRQALALINQTLDEVLAEQEGEFDGDTRWALAWFEQFGMDEGAFGMAETLSKAKNTAINGLVDAGLIAARAGKVRLLRRDELPADWSPATDNKVRHWEVAQHLIRALETGGETAAADLLRKVGGMGEVARDLAYRLYNLCERKKWAGEALAYNGLVISWPEISKLAQSGARPVESQGEMFG